MLSGALLVTASALLAAANAKVYELYHRDHWHDLIQDSAVGARAATVIAFYNHTSPCKEALEAMDFNANDMPNLDDLMIARLEMSTMRERVWYEYEDHLDLPLHLGINDYMAQNPECQCPILAFVPASYANEVGGWYLSNPSLEGVKIWDPKKHTKWKQWAWRQMRTTVHITQRAPYDVEITVSPHPGRTWYTKKLDGERTFKISAMESHTEFEAFVGDSIFVSKPPDIPKRVVHSSESLKPTPDSPAEIYTVHPPVNAGEAVKLNIVQESDGRWGFEKGIRAEYSTRRVKRRHGTTCMTHTRNLVGPVVLPKFDEVGFKKIAMPDGMHGRLVRYYQQHYHERAEEGWDQSGTQLNFAEVKTHMISLDHNFKERNSLALDVARPILEDWSSHKDLEMSAFYGIREYSEGAVLRSHIDRLDTHVFSAILQVGQTDMQEPWTVEVFGYDGKRYNIALKPGEMVLYESHALVHGRPKPLNGTQYSNAFVHFRPKNWEWSASKMWNSPEGKRILGLLHVDLSSIYR